MVAILWAFLVAVGLGLFWIIIKLIYRRARRGSHESHDITSNTTIWKEPAVPGSEAIPAVTREVNQVRRKTRLRSLDTFRGLSLMVMVFVNYGGGGYYFFEHAHWDGLYVADLVFPWFVWIMGVSVPFSLRGQLKRGKPKSRVFLRILERTVKLFFIGVCLGARNSPDMKTIRIPGVLQRLGFTYFVTAAVHLCFVTIKTDAPRFVRCCRGCRPLRDILYFWPEWIIMLSILGLQLCLTYLLPVPGCPTGYVGPGGLHKGGVYFNCTGGAAQYIDRLILTENQLYQYPTIQDLYKTTMAFDPEGILGTLTSIFMCFLGLQAGKIIVMYSGHTSRIVRWIFWAIITGVIGAVLCKGSQFEGWVPLNKNLWSVSFILVLTSMAYVLLIFLYLIIDIAKIWSGAPFIYPGMNSIVVYICQTVFSGYFPIAWAWPDYTLHWQRLFRAMWGSAVWVIMAYAMYIKKVFIAL